MTHNLLPLFFGILLAFCIVMYVVLDGFTLGTAILFFSMNDKERDIAASTILPTWDGNQTWLVLGMAMLYGAFPVAFSSLLPALYSPLLIMVVALLLRGVAFEFRLKSKSNKQKWGNIFSAASFLAAIIQGSIVGYFVQGLPTHYFNAFTLVTSLGLLSAYTLLGSTRLILKTTGLIQEKMYSIAKKSMIVSAFLLFAICLWTPLLNDAGRSLWLSRSNWPEIFLIPLLTISAGLSISWSLKHKKNHLPYWLSVLFVLCPYIGFSVNVYPYAVPYSITLWEASSPNSTLQFLLPGSLIMIPILLIYTAYAYHIFRGKITDVLHY